LTLDGDSHVDDGTAPRLPGAALTLDGDSYVDDGAVPRLPRAALTLDGDSHVDDGAVPRLPGAALTLDGDSHVDDGAVTQAYGKLNVTIKKELCQNCSGVQSEKGSITYSVHQLQMIQMPSIMLNHRNILNI